MHNLAFVQLEAVECAASSLSTTIARVRMPVPQQVKGKLNNDMQIKCAAWLGFLHFAQMEGLLSREATGKKTTVGVLDGTCEAYQP